MLPMDGDHEIAYVPVAVLLTDAIEATPFWEVTATAPFTVALGRIAWIHAFC